MKRAQRSADSRVWLRTAEIGAVLAVWVAAVAFIRPRGNFPIDDDWDFAIATWNFARTGHFHFTEFTAVSLRAQVLWGALWTRLLGESFEVLRLSTLVLGAGTLAIIHATLARAGAGPRARVIATAAFAFHPIFLWSACSFMTEVPFVFASALALHCFVRGFDEERSGWIAAGCAAAMTAWFVRQTGVTLLAAPLLLALMRRRLRDAAMIGGSLLFFLALLLYKRDWLAGSPQEFSNHFQMWREAPFRLPQQLAVLDHYMTFNVQNSALFFLPLTVPLVIAFMRRPRRPDVVIAAVAFVAILIRVQLLINRGLPMPYFVVPYCCDIFGGNILVDFGLGPQSMKGDYPFLMPWAARIALTYVSAIVGSLLVWALLRRTPRTNAALLAAGTALFGSLALLGSGLYVDRYSFDSPWPLVIVLALIVPWDSRPPRALAIGALVLIALFSTFSVQEYFAWNRARWTAVNDLRARGVPVTEIDAGSEPFHYLEMAGRDQKMRRITQWGMAKPYMVRFATDPGQRVIARYPWTGWLGLHQAALVVTYAEAATGTSGSAAREPANRREPAAAPAPRAVSR